MTRRLLIILFLLIAVSSVQATSYLKLWVNDAESNTLVQGDYFVWEFDVAVPGGSAMFQIYLDLDQNQVVSEGDLLLEQFLQMDGETGEDGPGDSSAVADGLVYSELGPFGFAPGDYILRAIDQHDQSQASAALHIDPLPSPGAVISGKVIKEDKTAPDNALANIMVGASVEDGYLGYWSGLTDENGDYSINLPAAGFNEYWEISIFFERQTEGYLPPDGQSVLVDNAVINDIDFYFGLPEAWVCGRVLDEFSQQLVAINDYGYLYNTSFDDGVSFSINDGLFSVPAIFDDEQNSAQFELSIWGEMGLIPDYLIPNTWNDDRYHFVVNKGDSLEKNIYVVPTDTSIYVEITISGDSPGQAFNVQIFNEDVGSTRGNTNTDGFGKFKVRSGYTYDISLNTDPEWGTPLPDGYILEEGNYQMGAPGDTVRYHLIPASNYISGALSFEEGDPVEYFDFNSTRIAIHDHNWTSFYQASIGPDFNYWQGVPEGTYTVYFEDWSGNYLALPAQYDNIVVENDTIENVNFVLNYANADITVKLKGAPSDALNYWMGIHTEGEWPNIYQTGNNAEADTTFYFRVCDGQWRIYAPHFGSEYLVSPSEHQVSVPPEGGNYYFEFQYTLQTSIGEKAVIPETFYVKQNYPNPFNPQTTIEFGMAERGHVEVTVFDLTGKVVQTLISGEVNAGVHKVEWNGSGYASGLYFYQVKTKNQNMIRRMVLIK